MAHRRRLLATVLAFALFTFPACSGGSAPSGVSPTGSGATLLPTVAPFPTVAALPTVAPLGTVAPQSTAASQATVPSDRTAAPPSGTPGSAGAAKVLLEDDFSDPASGWNSEQIGCCRFEYNSGAYRIMVPTADTVAFSLFPKQTFDNVSLEVDVAEIAGPASAIYGLACRTSRNYDKGYIFAIRPDTAHVIFYVAGSNEQRELKAVLKSSAIQPGKATNHLRADCSGSRLSFYANGQELIEVQDSRYQNGQVGMVVSTQPDSGGADVSFDNFVAREPAP